MTSLDTMYNGLSQVYGIKPEGENPLLYKGLKGYDGMKCTNFKPVQFCTGFIYFTFPTIVCLSSKWINQRHFKHSSRTIIEVNKLLQKSNKMLGKHGILSLFPNLFSQMCLINSIQHEHSCKILYLYITRGRPLVKSD